MSKSRFGRERRPLFCLLCVLLTGPQPSVASDTPNTSYSALSDTLVQRAQQEFARIEALVQQGTLAKSQLDQARERLEDAKDEAILARTLYAEVRIEDMTDDDAKSMIDAAQRRVDRQSKTVEDRRNLVDSGIIARAEFAAYQDELDARMRVLELAQNRVTLLGELKQMAEQEQRLENAARLNMPGLKNVMIRYEGNGLFGLGDLPAITSEFEKHFHRPLPISALGQTLVHQSMGLDHRNRVDVALNPDQPEGIWLRGLLERLHVPYLAFRSAVAGAATAPHIHIGTASSRLKLAQR